DKTRGGGPYRVLDDAADVVGSAGEVAEAAGGRPPVRDEREHHAADDDHLRRARDAPGGGRTGPASGSHRGLTWGHPRRDGHFVGAETGVPFHGRGTGPGPADGVS